MHGDSVLVDPKYSKLIHAFWRSLVNFDQTQIHY